MNKQINEIKFAIADARSTLAMMRTHLKELEKNQQWKSISNYEIRKCWRETNGNLLDFARAIEQALKEKNG